MAFVKARNPRLDDRFDPVATEYMRHGEALQVRWDYAFFQMLYETGNLGFGGDVRATQNNFAGLGATGRGEHGESFPNVSTGVLAHLQHLLLYSGEVVSAPVAERTRKVQEWGVLTSWQKGFKEPITFTDLARKWAPGAKGYASEIEGIAQAFYTDICQRPDPRPQLVAEARRGHGQALVASAQVNTPAPPAAAQPDPESSIDRPTGSDLARRAIEQARAEGKTERSGLGAGDLARKPAETLTGAPGSESAIPRAMGALGEAAPPAAAPGAGMMPHAAGMTLAPNASMPPPAANNGAASRQEPAVQTAMAGEGAKAAIAAPAPTPKCRVWTASYGGQKAVIIRAVSGPLINYTVLDVNEGSEKREAEAYIAAYAKGGQQVGEFSNQNLALDKAFELCPEG